MGPGKLTSLVPADFRRGKFLYLATYPKLTFTFFPPHLAYYLSPSPSLFASPSPSLAMEEKDINIAYFR